MEENNIDLVVTWMQPTKREIETRNKQRAIETGAEPAAFEEIRYRDWDVFNYWFRSMEKFVPWFNKIFLVIGHEDQIPSWLNTNHSKLRIIYQDDIIPKELVPTYNGALIEMFLSNIEELSEHFIYFCDDYLFIKHLDKEFFVKNNLPNVGGNIVENKLLPPIDMYYNMLNNNLKFENKIFPKLDHWYTQPHFPTVHSKSFEQEIINKYYDDIVNHFKMSRFKNKGNLLNSLFNDLIKLMNRCNYVPDMYSVAEFRHLRDNCNFNFKDKTCIICINDQVCNDFNGLQKRLKQYLNSVMPEKCSFEL